VRFKYLVIFSNGREERFVAESFVAFQALLERACVVYGCPFDLIYNLGRA
jgi:hypothetical protein